MTGRTLQQRWRSHLSAAKGSASCRFHHAIRKYGPDPWSFEILHETDEATARLLEAEEIKARNAMAKEFGYNAKPGGCGGWIVPESKVESWKKQLRSRAEGSINPNACAITNDEIIEVALGYHTKTGKIASHEALVEYGASQGKRVPKSFQQYRFGGLFKNLVKVLEQKTGTIYDPYSKSTDHKNKLSKANTGFSWMSNDNLKQTKQFKKNEFVPYGWVKGRKKYDQN